MEVASQELIFPGDGEEAKTSLLQFCSVVFIQARECVLSRGGKTTTPVFTGVFTVAYGRKKIGPEAKALFL